MTDVADRSTHSVSAPVDTSRVPFRVTDEAYVPSERYFDVGFFRLENEKLWMRAWQPACRLDEIPSPGDFTEYQILDQSVLMIRQADMSVKAFHNACRHRGTALGRGTGSYRAEQIVCPFHGWRYNLDGTNSYVYAERHFRPDCVEKAELNLRPLPVGIKWGMAWITFEELPTPFEENFHGIAEAVDLNRLDLMHVNWWHCVEFKANWKIAQEAFFEAFHVMQTHPQVAMFIRDDDYDVMLGTRYATTAHGHAWADSSDSQLLGGSGENQPPSRSGKSPAEHYYAMVRALWEGAQAESTPRLVALAEEVLAEYPHEHFFEEYYRRVYAEAAERNVPTPPPDPKMTGHWTVFPNFTGVCILGEALVYRSRPHPTDPNRCYYDFWSLSIPPEGAPVKRALEGQGPPWDDLWFVHQDASNIERQQIGLRTMGHKANRLAPDLERMIINWHARLDQVLAS